MWRINLEPRHSLGPVPAPPPLAAFGQSWFSSSRLPPTGVRGRKNGDTGDNKLGTRTGIGSYAFQYEYS